MTARNPFHPGELQVQKRAGAMAEGERNGSIISSDLTPGAQGFVEQQGMVVAGSADEDGNVWASVLVGEIGFVGATSERVLTIDLSRTFRDANDPLWKNIEQRPEVGMLFIELATRRRLRVNGRIEVRDDDVLDLNVSESFPNCPKYIQRREVTQTSGSPGETRTKQSGGNALGAEQISLIGSADTFFVASAHVERGVDASHRGGSPGFVTVVDDVTLRIPDFVGNNMFNTLGNIAENPRAGLVFVDFEGKKTLQLIGAAEILWDQLDPDGETGGTKRFWELKVDRWIQTSGPSMLTGSLLDHSPYNPIPGQ